VLKAELVRLDHMPFIARLPGLPTLVRGRRIEVDILATDEVDTTLELRVRQVLADTADEALDDDIAGLDPVDAASPAPGVEGVLPQGG
jgi:exoribonuclease-2